MPSLATLTLTFLAARVGATEFDLAYVSSFGDYGVDDHQWARPTHAMLVKEEGEETLLVVDNGNARVMKMREGKPGTLEQVGTFGEGNGTDSVTAPSCIATDGKLLAVADAGKHQVALYDLATGGFLRAVGSEAVLTSPIAVALHKGELWVVEYKGHEVSVLDLGTGALLRTVGKGEKGDGDGHLSEPRDVAFTGDEVIVTDLTNKRLAIFTEQGDFKRYLPGKFDQPYGVTIVPGAAEDGGDGLLIAEYHKQFGRVQLLDTQGNELAKPLNYVPDLTSEHGKKYIGGLNYIHYDPPSRRAFVGDMQSHKVHELTLDPEIAKQVRARDAKNEAERVAKLEL